MNKGNRKYHTGLSNLLLAMLMSHKNIYRFKSILFELEKDKYKENGIRVALSRLNKKDYLKKYNGTWKVTEKGKNYLKKLKLLDFISSPFKENAQANTIIAFDIPEKERVYRNWLRNQIKIFGYKMLQQSLWIGPGPLPLPFMERLNELKIRQNVKTFKISARK